MGINLERLKHAQPFHYFQITVTQHLRWHANTDSVKYAVA